MERGLYEQLITQSLLLELGSTADVATVGDIDSELQPVVLARHVEARLQAALTTVKDPERRVDLVNTILGLVETVSDDVLSPPRELRSVSVRPGPGAVAYGSTRPTTRLADAALLTNSRSEPNLGSEIKSEIGTCDSVDLLCAFVKWWGLRLLETELDLLRQRGAPLRVITTTYMGATDPQAVDRLVRDFGAEVKISYDSQRTRLHAKAWLFRRATGFDTAYVGSSNLSRAALLDGVEWNVRLSRVGTPALLTKFGATFDSYWNDASFESYDPDVDRPRLDEALAEAAGRKTHDRVTLSLSGLEVRPYPYQQTMLDAIEVERQAHDRHRNLVVAATGTGKTVVAALDYRRLCEGATRPTLLFVAHRREILEQSRRTYREVLNDASFGELYVGGERPDHWQHVFASVQTLTSFGVDNVAPTAYEVVVVDEFHHAESATYRRLLDRLEPRELLGLTATPERADGLDVRSYFGGRVAAELRLWDALDADLLCPFHYFAIADGTDLRDVRWSRGRYDDADLAGLYTGNRARAAIVIKQLRNLVSDPASMRGLGFCVSVAHAEFMAQVFVEAGLAARSVSGATSRSEREQALRDLRNGTVNVLFSADLFNEGLDVPDVDTVIFLRPTESAALFLQQLGRGLRRTREKAVLTVLDFVGHHRQEFRFDQRLRALTGETRRGLEREIERGFPFLPAGCQIIMDRQSQQIVLDNIRSQVGGTWASVVDELRSYGEVDLQGFLGDTAVDLSDLLRNGHSWTQARRSAGLTTRKGAERETELLKRVRALAHVDDARRSESYGRLLSDDAPPWSELGATERRLGEMLFFSLWPNGGGHPSIEAGLIELRKEEAARDELQAVIDLSFDTAKHLPLTIATNLHEVPLAVHGRYSREEVLSALGYSSLARKPSSFQTGVLYVPHLDVDAFFVTIQKSEVDYSPTTLYRDYPISPDLFHWETQAATSVKSPTGERYLRGTSTKLLFVRQTRQGELGTNPYLFAGALNYVQHAGDRPIGITWRLEHPLPSDFFAAATVVAS